MSQDMTPGSDPTAAPVPGSPPADHPSSTGGASVARLILVAVFGIAMAAVGLATALRPAPSGTAETHPERATAGQVGTAGRFEITARLVEMPGKFLANDGLYNYAFVLKYDVLSVHRSDGHVESTVYVAHYNPRKTRAKVADEFYSDLGGNLERFRAGELHRLALEQPWDEHYIGPLVDRYHEVAGKRIYWAIWSNAAGGG